MLTDIKREVEAAEEKLTGIKGRLKDVHDMLKRNDCQLSQDQGEYVDAIIKDIYDELGGFII